MIQKPAPSLRIGSRSYTEAWAWICRAARSFFRSPRTLRNWESGKKDIPYSAYRLLRLLNRMELPGASWSGWCFHGGKLWSPEGRSFEGTDSAWWSLLVRRAACFDTLFKRSGQFEQALMAMAAERRTTEGPDAARGDAGGCVAPRAAAGEASSLPGACRGAARSAGPNLLIVHFRTHQHVFGANTGPYAIKPVAKTAYSLVAANKATVKGVA